MSKDRTGSVLLREMKERFEAERASLCPTNLLIAGRDPAISKTIVEGVFGKDVRMGNFFPSESHANQIVHLWSCTPEGDDTGLSGMASLIEGSHRSPEPARHIHQAWLCIPRGSLGPEPFDLEFADFVSRHIPMFVIIAGEDGAASSPVRRSWKIPHARGIHQVTLQNGAASGFLQLAEQALEYLPEGCSAGFVASQRVSIGLKRRWAEPILKRTVAEAREALENPISGFSFSHLVRVNLGMLAEIAVVFGVSEMALLHLMVEDLLGIKDNSDVGLLDAFHRWTFGSEAHLNGNVNSGPLPQSSREMGLFFMDLLEGCLPS